MNATVTLKNETIEANKAMFKNFVTWFEIPAYNHTRSICFYNCIFNIHIKTMELNGFMMGFFPTESGIGGAIITGPGCVPSDVGPLLYLNGGHDLNTVLCRVNKAGGRVVMEKTFLNEEAGYFALFIDSEGNRLALHSKS